MEDVSLRTILTQISFIVLCFAGYWPFGDIWCRTVQYFINVCAYASIYTLVLMSLDRYLAVVHPITSMQLRVERNSLIACALLWVIIVVVCIPVAFIHGNYRARNMLIRTPPHVLKILKNTFSYSMVGNSHFDGWSQSVEELLQQIRPRDRTRPREF